MIIQEQSKKIFILGAGGHGIESILEFILLSKHHFYISYLPVDYGGSTGNLTRVIEFDNNFINNLLHSDSNHPSMPFGDFTKLAGYLLIHKFQDSAKIDPSNRFSNSILEFRSNDFYELSEKFDKLKDLMNLELELCKDFSLYLKKYLELLNSVKYRKFSLIDTSFGNIWHNYCYFKFGTLNRITLFYLQNLQIKSDISTVFTFEKRQVLVGQTIADEFLIGEDIVDVSQKSILPYSLKILGQNKSWIEKPWSDQVFDYIAKSEVLIIPNGSIANWIALINSSFEIRDLLKKKSKIKPIIMFSNLFYSQNEFPIESYLELLVDNYDIRINLLTPDSDDYLGSQNAEAFKFYDVDMKKPNQFYNNQRFSFLETHQNLKVTRCLKVELNSKLKGLKYEGNSIEKALDNLI